MTKLLDGRSSPGLAEARLELANCIACYNDERRHSALGYRFPHHFETQLQTTPQKDPAELGRLNSINKPPA